MDIIRNLKRCDGLHYNMSISTVSNSSYTNHDYLSQPLGN